MKPVNLNQLLFHSKSDCLTFFQSPSGDVERPEEIDTFLQDMKAQLEIQEKKSLAVLLEKNSAQIKKIIRSHPNKTHGFFFADDLQGYVEIEEKIDSYCIIGQNFHIRPLLEELFVNPEFMVINVSLYDIKIFRGDFQHLEVIQHYEFDQLPKNFNDFPSRVYAPQYLGLIPYKTILALKTIAQKVKDMILYHSMPVIVTGLEEMKNIFLRYFGDTMGIISHVQEDFYEKTCVEVVSKCKGFRSMVMDYYSAQLKDRLKRMITSKRLISDMSEIIRASHQGKIIRLILPPEKKLWGKLDLEKGEFTLHEKETKNSVDILNQLAEEVVRQGGRIQVLGPHFFPSNASVLAILRGI